MNQRVFVGWGLIVTVLLFFFKAYVLDPILNIAVSNGLNTFGGLLIVIFAIWGGILLLQKSRLTY